LKAQRRQVFMAARSAARNVSSPNSVALFL
jgi:hypothetical protein